MAFTNGLRSPQNDSSFPAYNRPIGSQPPNSSTTTPGLHRRFTTNQIPTIPTLSSMTPLSPIGQQRRQAAEPTADIASVLQKRKEEYEATKRRQSELEILDLRAKDELQRLEKDIYRLSMSGHQSEPTTPPEYRDNGFPSAISRPNRLSLASMASTPGIGSIASPRANRSGSQSIASTFTGLSVPGSRRGSDEERDDYQFEIANLGSRRQANLNRNSMPVTNFDYRSMPDVESILGMPDLNSIIGYDMDEETMPSNPRAGSIDGPSLLHMDTNSEGFPLLRRHGDSIMQPASSSGVMSANHGEDGSNGSYNNRGHRVQVSLPANGISRNGEYKASATFDTPPKNNRRSMDLFGSPAAVETSLASKRSSMQSLPGGFSSVMPKLTQSYSTNDIPTVKNTGAEMDLNGNSAANLSHAEKHLHNHNASMGRNPMNANNRLSRDFAAAETRVEDKGMRQMPSSGLQANAPAFGPTYNNNSSAAPPQAPISPQNGNSYNQAPFYAGYGVSAIVNGISNMNVNSPPPAWNGPPLYQGNYGNNYQGYQPYGLMATNPSARYNAQDSQARVIQQRRTQSNDDSTRYANFKLENMRGQIYELCKDQHGCRFLQRKLEDHDPEHVDMIFEETKEHVVELMTDPFGNYLCQKLLEFSTDNQRTELINNAAPDMVKIAFNQHGTRALQKMIEFISTREQIETVKGAFEQDVVGLIQDLNGNHVIQKCLNHLKPVDAEFIFDAVGYNCLVVGTHRHGCCVLQRCIDHATGAQKAKLVGHVIQNAYSLVQDPFGNYVVQYILDLSIPDFTRPLCSGFAGRIVELSKQKFSSNVMEKCIRVADMDIKRGLIDEFVIAGSEMEKLLRDNFANYVVQTALEHGDQDNKDRLWEVIIPIMGNIRSTPCGRRLASKLQGRTSGGGLLDSDASNNGQLTPISPSSAGLYQMPPQPYSGYPPANGMNVMNGMNGPNGYGHSNGYANGYTNGYSANIASPQPHRLNGAAVPTHLQHAANQPAYSSGRRGYQPQGASTTLSFF
ncbi:hypothetical protein Vi05172_g2273 [Venturia inaequalis]|nr:hypothetical protein Vi05172_g2273 [Venturia inaequalis]